MPTVNKIVASILKWLGKKFAKSKISLQAIDVNNKKKGK